ncbi:MAG: dihydrolipoyl dehydrogenase [Thermoleophilia bacterium]
MTRRIVVLGGGPAGYVAALRAAQLGARVALVESRAIGGTCLNRGCIPTKALVAATERLRRARDAAGFGVVLGAPQVDFGALLARKGAVVEQQRGGVEHLLKARKVEVVAGFGRLVDAHTVRVTGQAGESGAAGAAGGGVRDLISDAVIIATGSQPTMLPVFDVDDQRVMTSDQLLELDRLPASLAIVGGGAIGCEFAAIFAELGARVTIVEMLDQLVPGEDRRAAAALSQAFRKAGIESRLKTRVERVDVSLPDEVGLALADGSTVAAALVLVSVGRSPVSRGLGLEEAGVEIDEHGFVVTDLAQRTSLADVFAAGDVAGPPLLAHWAYRQGAAAAENAVLGGSRTVDRRFVPNCIFSHPEVASFGTTEDQAKAENLPIVVAQVRFNANSKAVIEGESDGYIRIIARAADRRVIGASLVGPHVTELVHELVLAARAGLTLDDVADTIHAHPTLAEAVGEAALGAAGRGMHTL